MEKYLLTAQERKLLGRKVKALRREGFLPANIYGKKIKSFSVKVDQKEFAELFKKAGETSIVELVLGKEKRPVLIHNIQRDPVTDTFVHVDFYQVDLKSKVTAQIPVDMIGEPPAEKQGLGTLVQYIDEVEIEALPSDLPEKFEIDASIFTEVDKAYKVGELKYDRSKIEVKEDAEQLIAKVEPLREEEVEAPAPQEEGVAEATGEEAATESKEEASAEQTSDEPQK